MTARVSIRAPCEKAHPCESFCMSFLLVECMRNKYLVFACSISFHPKSSFLPNRCLVLLFFEHLPVIPTSLDSKNDTNNTDNRKKLDRYCCDCERLLTYLFLPFFCFSLNRNFFFCSVLFSFIYFRLRYLVNDFILLSFYLFSLEIDWYWYLWRWGNCGLRRANFR